MFINVFCEKYNISSENLARYRRENIFDKKMFIVRDKKRTLINDSLFMKRADFRQKVIMYNHDMYYFLSDFFTNVDLAESLSKYSTKYKSVESWNVFIGTFLFSIPSVYDSIDYRIPKRQWCVFKYFRKIERQLKKKYENFDVAEILDKRMIKC